MADDSLWTTLNTRLWLLYPATALWGNSWGMISYITCRWSRSKLFWWSPWCQTIPRFRTTTRSSSTCLCHTLLCGSFAYNIAHTWYSVGGEIKLLSLISIFTLSLQCESGQKHTTPASWLRCWAIPLFHLCHELHSLDDTAWFSRMYMHKINHIVHNKVLHGWLPRPHMESVCWLRCAV